MTDVLYSVGCVRRELLIRHHCNFYMHTDLPALFARSMSVGSKVGLWAKVQQNIRLFDCTYAAALKSVNQLTSTHSTEQSRV